MDGRTVRNHDSQRQSDKTFGRLQDGKHVRNDLSISSVRAPYWDQRTVVQALSRQTVTGQNTGGCRSRGRLGAWAPAYRLQFSGHHFERPIGALTEQLKIFVVKGDLHQPTAEIRAGVVVPCPIKRSRTVIETPVLIPVSRQRFFGD